MLPLIAAALAALTLPSMTLYELENPARVEGLAFEDWNGDGLRDIAAFTHRQGTTKTITVYLSAGGEFAKDASVQIDIPPAAGAVFLSETDGVPPKELVVGGATALQVYRFDAGTFSLGQTIAIPSLFPQSVAAPRLFTGVAGDIDGDGRDEWAVPTAEGVRLYRLDTPLALVPAVPGTQPGAGNIDHVTYPLPMTRVLAAPGGAARRLAVLTDEHLWTLAAPGTEPAAKQVLPYVASGPFLPARDLYNMPRNALDAAFPQMPRPRVHAAIHDFNVDGHPDVLLNQTGGAMGMESRTAVHLGRPNGQLPATPDAEFRKDGAFAHPTVHDVNGDGHPDILFLEIPVGVRFFANLLVRGRVTLRAEAYLWGPQGFPDSPDVTGSYTFVPPEPGEAGVFAHGDFNGDGHLDTAVGLASGGIAIHTGSTKDAFSSSPWQTLNISAHGQAAADDLDGDGRDELLVYHRPPATSGGEITVVKF